MKREFTWGTTHSFKLVAESKTTLKNIVVDADGDIVTLEEKEQKEEKYIAIYVDGKLFCENGRSSAWWQVLDVEKKRGYKRLHCLPTVAFPEEIAEQIQAFLNAVIEEGKDEEVKASEAAERAKRKASEIARCERVIKAAERQRDIPTKAEARARMESYNNVVNEGGEGFVPYIYSIEEYEAAKERLAELKG